MALIAKITRTKIKIHIKLRRVVLEGRVLQSVALLTGKPESQRHQVRYPVRPHIFVKIDHEIFSTVISSSPPSTDSKGQSSATGESMGTEYWFTADEV